MNIPFSRVKVWSVSGALFSSAIVGSAAAPISQETQILDLAPGVTMEFVLVPSGSFLMGSDLETGDADEIPRHRVTITQPYYLGKYEVTQQQWETVMGYNPSSFKGASRPVDSVSWDDCQVFLAKVQARTGRQIALPTEAQWEYACRAGTTTRWSFGNSDAGALDAAWIGENSGNTTHPVGQKKPNAWGLYDMHGNVWEWCSDWYTRPYPTEAVVDPRHPGPLHETSPVLRGGGWGEHPNSLRSAYRNCSAADVGHNGTGLRCLMVASPTTDPSR